MSDHKVRSLHTAIIPKYTQANNSYTPHYQRLQPLEDLNSSTVETEASSTSHESIALHKDISRRFIRQPDQSMVHNVTLAHYNNTSTYSMSNMSNKFDASTVTDLSDDDDIDNIIYADINDLHKQQRNTQTSQTQTSIDINNFEMNLSKDEVNDEDDEIKPYVSRISLQKMIARQPLIINNGDLYATIDRRAKAKIIKPLLTTDVADEINLRNHSKTGIEKNYSSEFIDDSIRNINNVLNSIENYQYQASLNYDEETKYYPDECANSRSNFNSYANHYSSHSNEHSQMIRCTNESASLHRNSEMSGVESVDSYDSHYITHNPKKSENNETLLYASIMKPENNSSYKQTTQKHSSTERLADVNPNLNIYTTLEYNKSLEENNEAEHTWRRSASCRELHNLCDDFKEPEYMMNEREFLTTESMDSPFTRCYDEFRRSNYETNRKYSMDFTKDFNLPETKVYSSSYPGTTYNTIDQNFKWGTYSQYEYNESQDLSHDSYELLEKSDDDFYYKFKHTDDYHERSCSLDSGNFIATDFESDEERNEYAKYRPRLDMKSRSAADIINDVFLFDDPRDLPKEKLCVKSDGSFYKHVKESMGIRTSSQESQSEFYQSRISKSSSSSKKSKDSVYHTDSKKSRETLKSKSGSDNNVSSPEEKFLVGELLNRNNYEMPTTTAKKTKNLKKMFEKNSRSSIQDPKTVFYDAKLNDQNFKYECETPHTNLLSHNNLSYDNIQSSYDTKVHFSTFPSNRTSAKSSNVQSISLQNVKIERNLKTFSAYQTNATIIVKPNNTERFASKKTHIWPEEIEGLQTEITGIERAKNYRKRSDGDANIFSFDKDKIESMTSSQSNENIECEKLKKSPEYPLTPELLSKFDKQKIESPNVKPKMVTRKEELIAKTHFEEYNPKLMMDPKIQLPVAMPYPHASVERTKSDPNSLANRPRITGTSRRLMHQKSIDLTPADSSEDEYLYKQIPSAPPVFRNQGTHFEIPQSYDPRLGQIDIIIPKTGFELPQNFFEEYEKRMQNIQVKDDIPYVLHKRHIMNGTAPSPNRCPKPKSPKSPKSPQIDKIMTSFNETRKTEEDFLFIKDLSKVDTITFDEKENTKKLSNHSSPKRNITKRLDPKVLETLNSKLSQIESDSATSSKTDSAQKVIQQRIFGIPHKIDLSNMNKEAILSGKRAVKQGRSVQNKNKIRSRTKTRITSFSSDDESIDSDDVFGSAEPMPTKMEFSPPQSRKDIEPILKHEHSKLSQAAWARGQTMSSTEIEGSPPQCRKLAELENRYNTNKLDSHCITSSELRRISERSISIPSSDDGDGGQSTLKCELATEIHRLSENFDEPEERKNTNNDELSCRALTKTCFKNKEKIFQEFIDSSMIIRSKGHVPVLFAHARLNLSEGSAFASQKRQTGWNDSLSRRAKSLDTPVISLNRLPPINSFSSKDDTKDELEGKAENLEVKGSEKKTFESYEELIVCPSELPVLIEDDEFELLDRLKYIEKITLQGVKIKEKRKSRSKLISGDILILEIPKYKYEPFSSGNSSLKTSPVISRASSVDSRSKRNGFLNVQTSPKNLVKDPTIKPEKVDSKKIRKFQDAKKGCEKLKVPFNNFLKSGKERSKSLEKMDPKNSSTKSRKSITEETELEKAKRKEKQQKLYESAMKQTISILSPIKDPLTSGISNVLDPQFPMVEDSNLNNKSGGSTVVGMNLKNKLEDCVLIAKSPRKLDSQSSKYSRSCEESKSIEKIDKANRSFDDRNKSEFEDSEKSDNLEEKLSTIQNKIIATKEEIKAQIEGNVVHKKIQQKSRSLEKKADITHFDYRNKTKSLDNYLDSIDPTFNQDTIIQKNAIEEDKQNLINTETRQTQSSLKYVIDESVPKVSSIHVNIINKFEKKHDEQPDVERRTLTNPDSNNEDMQAIISERRSLDLMKRHSRASHDAKDATSISLFTSVSLEKLYDSSVYYFSRIPTIECEGPSIEKDVEEQVIEENYPISEYQNVQQKIADNKIEHCAMSDKICNIDRKQPEGSEMDDLSNLTKCTDEKMKQEQLLYHVQAATRRNFLKLNIDKSRSSDTASSMDKDGTPNFSDRKDSSASFSNKQKSSVEDESSLSCSIAKPLGISQDFVDQNEQIRCKELRDTMMRLEGIVEASKVMKKVSPALEKQLPIDLGSGSELDSTTDPNDFFSSNFLRFDANDSGSDLKPKTTKYPRDLGVCKKVTRAFPIEDLSQPPEQLQAKLNGAKKYLNATNSSSLESKSSAGSKRSLSGDSKESFETESSSGSLGKAQQKGDLSQRQMQITWKSFPFESSGSEENWQPDHESYERYEIAESFSDTVDEQKESDSDFQDELNELPQSSDFTEGSLSNLSVNNNPADILGYGTGFAIGRTLSRISERSSEKSSVEEEKTSIDDDITAHEEGEEDESIVSSDHQASISSDILSNSNQAYVSDTDRRTSAEMPDIPCDSAAAERLADLYTSKVKTTLKLSVENLRENKSKSNLKSKFLPESGSSQESEDWPLPEVPTETSIIQEHRPLFAMDNKPVPNMSTWRGTGDTYSQESDIWPSSDVETIPVIEDVHTFYISKPQKPQKIVVESLIQHQIGDDDEPDYADIPDIFKEPRISPYTSIVLPYDQAAYFMDKNPKILKDKRGCFDSQVTSSTCLKSTLQIFTTNKATPVIGKAKISSLDKVIVTQPTRCSSSLQSPISEDEFFLIDEVFNPGTVKIEISPDEGKLTDFNLKTFSRSSNNSDTSIDDILSTPLNTHIDDSQRRSSLVPGRLSSGSFKKCSGGSHSEEETSSFGTDLDGTVKLGVTVKRCNHSSHSEDTSVGVSLSEWSTGTNTVRQYANLSGSDSLSALETSNHSNGIKSEKSNNTKSSISSINKSSESLNEKSISLSCGKNIPYSIENLSRDTNSETDKITSSGTNDESTLTLTEMVHSITEWSTSSSQAFVEKEMNKSHQQIDFKLIDKSKSTIEYKPLRPPKNFNHALSIDKNQETVHGVHNIVKSKVDTSIIDIKIKPVPKRLPPKIIGMIEKPKIFPKPQVPPPPVEDSVTGFNNSVKRKFIELISHQYGIQDVSDTESYNEKLYNQTEKLCERYQSQEFSPFTVPTKPPRESKTQEQILSKNHSYDDKTLSKSQIREYKSTKVRQSHSFHEHLLSSDSNKIQEEKLSSSTTQTSETSTENSPKLRRPDKLAKCSPYYSSSLSSDTPEVHNVVQKPPRRPINLKTLISQSSNDTDSSLDFRQNDQARNRAPGCRKKKQIPITKRTRKDYETEYLGSSECSEGYFPDITSSSSDNAKGGNKYPDLEEETDTVLDNCDDYSYHDSKVTSYPSTTCSTTKFETLDLSEYTDGMLPKCDRLRHATYQPIYMPPTKPLRQRKKIQGKTDKLDTNNVSVHYGQDKLSDGSGTEIKADLSDICYSSGDSYAASFNNQEQQTAGHYFKNGELLGFSEFLTDKNNSDMLYLKPNDSEKSFESDEDDSYNKL